MKVKGFLLSLVMLITASLAKADLQPVNGWYEIGNYDELQEFIMLLRNGQTGIYGKLTAGGCRCGLCVQRSVRRAVPCNP